MTGFITVPDVEAQPLETVHGRVDFIELVGVTDAELQQILNEEETAQGLYARLGSDQLSQFGPDELEVPAEVRDPFLQSVKEKRDKLVNVLKMSYLFVSNMPKKQ